MGYITYTNTILPSATITVKPGLTEQWLLKNVLYGGTISLSKCNANNTVTFAETLVPNSCTLGLDLVLDVYNWIEILSEDSSTITVAYDIDKL